MKHPKLKILLGSLVKGAIKLLPFGGVATDLIDNKKAAFAGLKKPHTNVSIILQAGGFLLIAILLLAKVITVDEILRLIKEIQEIITPPQI